MRRIDEIRLSAIRYVTVTLPLRQVVRRIDEIRLSAIRDPAKKIHLQRSIVRYCRVSDTPEDPL